MSTYFIHLSVVSAPDILPWLQQLIWVLLLIIGAAFFAGSETALFSLSRAQRELFSQGTEFKNKRILWLLQKPQRLITTLILGNELINVSISTLVTKFMETKFSNSISEVWIGVFATFFTVPILILFGELIPKTIAIKTAPRWSRIIATPLFIITWALWLPRTLISTISNGILFLLRQGKIKAHEITPALKEKELRTLVDLGNAEGEIENTEHRMIHNVFDFGDLTAGQIMTKTENLFALSVDMPTTELREKISRNQYARIPMYRTKIDNIIGILFAKDLVGKTEDDLHSPDLVHLLHSPLFVPQKAKCERLLREFRRRKTHLALVVDEYGRLAGLITMDDLLQTLFGNLEVPS